MLGLPDTIRGCLFDLDGVLTKTATVHDAAWTEMFDSFLRERSRATGQPFVPFDPVKDYDEYIDGKPRLDGTRAFLASRGIDLPLGREDDPPGTDTCYGLGNRKNEILLAKLSLVRGRGVRGIGPLRARCREGGPAPGGRVLERELPADPRAAGIEDLFEERIDGVVAKREHLRGKPAPDTFLAGARALGLEPAQAAVFEDALAGVEAGRAGKFGYVVGVDRVGQADELRQHGAERRRDRPEQAAGSGMIAQPEFSEEPWSLRETGLDLSQLAQTESVFALSNGHVGWRGVLDEGEPHGLPGSYLNGVYEVRPLPVSESAYGRPESGQTVINVTNGKLIRLFVDDEPFDVRYGRLLSHERLLDFRAGTLRRQVEWASPVGRVRPGYLDSPGVVHPSRDRCCLLRGGAGQRQAADHGAVRAHGE